MSWLVAGRAYVIKLSHDKQPRSGVRAKNYSSALVKCRIKRILLSHPNLRSNFSLPPPYTNPHFPSPSPSYLLNLEFETTRPRMSETVWSSQDPIQLSIFLLLSLSEVSQFGPYINGLFDCYPHCTAYMFTLSSSPQTSP